ncbi:MAG TPA: DUF4142 domain-containing protein [Polyangiaceae bacterium]
MALRISVAALLVAVAGCQQHEPARSAAEPGAEPGMKPASRVVVPAEGEPEGDNLVTPKEDVEHLDDQQIIGMSEAIDSVEIEQAKLAIFRAEDGRVKRFASGLIAHHARARDERAALETRLSLQPAESRAATRFRVEAAADQKELGAASGSAFDKLFLETQVDTHERALATYDEKLVAHAGHPDLKLYLQRMRPRLAAHLEQARALLDELD